jgi:hypothetical protein
MIFLLVAAAVAAVVADAEDAMEDTMEGIDVVAVDGEEAATGVLVWGLVSA